MDEKPQNQSIIVISEPARAIIVKDEINKLFDGLFNLPYPLQTLEFINTSTEEIEPDFLKGQEVYSLIVQENNIKVVQTYTFRNLKLTDIDLSRNGIQLVENLAFANLSNLEEIYLDENKLTTLNSKAYENLPKLRKLTLMKNYITLLAPSSFDFVKTRYFVLSLSHNRIANIDEDAFKGSNGTNVNLFLDNNLLQQISVNIFHNHSFLEVRLKGNKIRKLTGNLERQNFKITMFRIDNNFDKKSLKSLLHWTIRNDITLDCETGVSTNFKNLAQPKKTLGIPKIFLNAFKSKTSEITDIFLKV
ncbi:insulin-like growth factor-binding protein complex acid labile subunit [Zophobas morio]|uniref:insulin-like growth factor-binding protein complex acid labile subunit n=1 Tax=Zophobas morio TaxID=2755281 RepID=UPI003082BFA3